MAEADVTLRLLEAFVSEQEHVTATTVASLKELGSAIATTKFERPCRPGREE